MKNALIITYYWPPSGGGGVQRWLKFAKYLPEFGWKPIIFTPESPAFALKDYSLEKEVNPELEVLRFPIWEPYGIFGKRSQKQGVVEDKKNNSLLSKLMIWSRGNLIIPDPRVFWVKPSVKFLQKLIIERNVDVIITTGPPHSMHLIGLQLKHTTGVKWISDFRDPWSDWDILKELKVGKLAMSRHKKLEKKVVEKADRVITVSKDWAKRLGNRYNREIDVITNGFDLADFKDTGSESDDSKFTIIHAGLLNSFRDPNGLWAALEELCKEDSTFSNSLKILLAGTIDARVLEALRNNETLNPKLQLQEYIPHKDLMVQYHKSDVLLLLSNNSPNESGHIPGKLFEYLAVSKPILMFGDKQGDAARIVENTGSGVVLDRDNVLEIKKAIIDFFQIRGHRSLDLEKKEKYSRKHLTSDLAQIMNDL